MAGVRAGLCTNERQAVMARNDDDINVLCLASNFTDEEEAEKIVLGFLMTSFGSEERYIRRLNKIKEYESNRS